MYVSLITVGVVATILKRSSKDSNGRVDDPKKLIFVFSLSRSWVCDRPQNGCWGPSDSHSRRLRTDRRASSTRDGGGPRTTGSTTKGSVLTKDNGREIMYVD